MADEGRKRKMQRKKGANLMKNLFKKIGALLVAAVMVLAMASRHLQKQKMMRQLQ